MKRLLFGALLLAGATTLLAADTAQVVRDAGKWRAQHEREIVAEFADLLALPNLASDSANIGRNAAAIKAMLEKRGVTVRVLTLEGAPPIVVGDLPIAVGDLPAKNSKRTIAFYAHYDGQPVDATQWKGAPWTPVMRDVGGNDVDWRDAKAIDPEWRLFARSAGDDKAPIIGMLAALDALRAAGRKPSVNLRFVFEGEEEAGSPHLSAFLERYPDALRPDAWVLCDGPVHQSRRMLLAFGARGVVDLDLTV
jgi:acetylornithine deacetylase/succinyl-diaminopimelate desuccinylase-like protein